tara:strand:+ start:410 stop:616 length:207 start_codon:yes stop_codon:yes gene_type:complete
MAKASNKKGPRGGRMKASPPAKIIANANNIRPIQTYEDPREGLRKWTDPKRYNNPDSPDGSWPRKIRV